MDDGERNPFKMPTDEEVFALRDEEQQRKRQERELAKQMHVWEKGVISRPPVRDYEGELSEQAQAQAAQQSKLNLVAAATRDRRKEKENMADFIAKKREMFLVQMSLDTKRAEIRKLEERAQQREEVGTRQHRQMSGTWKQRRRGPCGLCAVRGVLYSMPRRVGRAFIPLWLFWISSRADCPHGGGPVVQCASACVGSASSMSKSRLWNVWQGKEAWDYFEISQFSIAKSSGVVVWLSVV